MLRRDLSHPNPNGAISSREPKSNGSENIDIQQELNKLEEMILDSPCIPLSRRAVVDEEQFLEQLDLIRLNLPPAFQEAAQIVQHQEALLLDAEGFAEEIVVSAERRASEILDEVGIIQQAQLQAEQIRQQVQQDCTILQQQTLEEVERIRQHAKQELEDMRQHALNENEEIRQGADMYADQTLQAMEQQLTDVVRIIRNGRAQLRPEAPPPTPATKPPANTTQSGSSKLLRETDPGMRAQPSGHDRARRQTKQHKKPGPTPQNSRHSEQSKQTPSS